MKQGIADHNLLYYQQDKSPHHLNKAVLERGDVQTCRKITMHPMQELKDKLQIILDVIPPSRKIFYLDMPIHLNVGDLLIMKGTEHFFTENNFDVLKRYSVQDYVHLLKQNKIDKEVTIVLHGGGNFGDMYPLHQRLREAIIKRFTGNKIVILPQTVHFQNKSNMVHSSKEFGDHPDLTIFARDHKSAQILKENFPSNILLCPDMAHSLWGKFPTRDSNVNLNKILYLLRKDIEKADFQTNPESLEHLDWDDICRTTDKLILRIVRIIQGRINTQLPFRLCPATLLWLWYRYTDLLIDRINSYFLSHDKIVTSRLHGYILSCLLDIPSELIDNSYGKNHEYYNSWTKNISNCKIIS